MTMENTEPVKEVKDEPVKEDKKEKDLKTGVEKVKEEKAPSKEKEEPVKEEPKEDKAVNEELDAANKTVADLKEQLKAHQEKLVDYDAVKKELDEKAAQVEKAENKVKEYEELLNKMIDEKMKKVPQEFAELVPSNMTITQQLDWLVKAESKNLFNTSKKNLDVEIGKPMGATVNTKANIKDMNSSSLLSMAYNVIKK